MDDLETDRNMGPQPLAALLQRHDLKPHDLVAVSSAQLTHKMIARAVKGRRLTRNTAAKVLAALNAATGNEYSLADAFNYEL